MADKSTEKYVIDLEDYICRPVDEEDLQDPSCDLGRTTMPCDKLGWCPYGRLAAAFPASTDALDELGISHEGLGAPYSHAKILCPAFLLASPRLAGCAPFAKCWDLDMQCDTCRIHPDLCEPANEVATQRYLSDVRRCCEGTSLDRRLCDNGREVRFRLEDARNL